jgi:hypothetical protein
VQIVEDDKRAGTELRETGTEEAPREWQQLIGVLGAEEARDVLVAFVDAVPDVRSPGLLKIVGDRDRLAVTGRGRDPAGAGTKTAINRRQHACAANDLHRSRCDEFRYGVSGHAPFSSV